MKLFRIVIYILLTGIMGCSTASNLLVDERTNIEKYLSEQKIAYENLSGAYRFTVNADRPEYPNAKTATYGDSVKMSFAACEFKSGIGGMFFTNMAWLVAEDTVLNPKYWNFAPKGIKLGETPLISGLNYGLNGCREGDSLQIFLTSDLGYGKKPNSVIPPNTPLVWIVKITEVKNNK